LHKKCLVVCICPSTGLFNELQWQPRGEKGKESPSLRQAQDRLLPLPPAGEEVRAAAPPVHRLCTARLADIAMLRTSAELVAAFVWSPSNQAIIYTVACISEACRTFRADATGLGSRRPDGRRACPRRTFHLNPVSNLVAWLSSLLRGVRRRWRDLKRNRPTGRSLRVIIEYKF